MLIPSIDLRDGDAVQLIGGQKERLNAGDPFPIASLFGRAGEIAVVDLDAALGTGNNKAVVEKILALAPCRVGGGIRDTESALDWLDAGANKVVLGTAANPRVLSRLPKDRVIAALDAVNGEVVVEGWRRNTGRQVLARLRELNKYVGGFLVTFVEKEGRMGGVDLDGVKALLDACGEARLTVAGGVNDAAEVGALDRMGVDAQVGMALYTKRFDLAGCFAAVLHSDRSDGLWPTIVCDESGCALGLAYSNEQSLRRALVDGRGVYFSRRRGLWIKGETSGATQDLIRVDADCDRDVLRFVVRQGGTGFCHRKTRSCFGEGWGIGRLARRLHERAQSPREGSYTNRLLSDAGLLRSKLIEEAAELAEAAAPSDVTHEAADVLYFLTTAMARAGIGWPDVEKELDRRRLYVRRRFGKAKTGTEGEVK